MQKVVFFFLILLPAEEADQNTAMAPYLEVTRIRDCHLVVPSCYCKPFSTSTRIEQTIHSLGASWVFEGKKIFSLFSDLSILLIPCCLSKNTVFKKASDGFPDAQQKLPGKMILILAYLIVLSNVRK